jgi:hypothetical protein
MMSPASQLIAQEGLIELQKSAANNSAGKSAG